MTSNPTYAIRNLNKDDAEIDTEKVVLTSEQGSFASSAVGMQEWLHVTIPVKPLKKGDISFDIQIIDDWVGASFGCYLRIHIKNVVLSENGQKLEGELSEVIDEKDALDNYYGLYYKGTNWVDNTIRALDGMDSQNYGTYTSQYDVYGSLYRLLLYVESCYMHNAGSGCNFNEDAWKVKTMFEVGPKLTNDEKIQERFSNASNALYYEYQMYLMRSGEKQYTDERWNAATNELYKERDYVKDYREHLNDREDELKAKLYGSGNRSSLAFDFQDVFDNVLYYVPGNSIDPDGEQKLASKLSTVINIITSIGMVVAVLMPAVVGIKYMLSSVEEKAEYKKDMIPYLVGAFLLFSICTVVKILQQFGQSINNI